MVYSLYYILCVVRTRELISCPMFCSLLLVRKTQHQTEHQCLFVCVSMIVLWSWIIQVVPFFSLTYFIFKCWRSFISDEQSWILTSLAYGKVVINGSNDEKGMSFQFDFIWFKNDRKGKVLTNLTNFRGERWLIFEWSAEVLGILS